MNKFSLKLIVLLITDVFSAMITYMLFKMSTAVMNNFPFFIINLVVTIIFFAFTFRFVLKGYIYGELYYVNIKILAISCVITLLVSASLYKYLTDFSFEKWQSKKSLRPFMVNDLCEIQNSSYKKEEYNLNRYTREEVKELLSINSKKRYKR